MSLGWISLELFVYVKKLLFVRTLSVLGTDSVYKRVFCESMVKFSRNRIQGRTNAFKSPTFDILSIAEMLGLYEEYVAMLEGTRLIHKEQWKSTV